MMPIDEHQWQDTLDRSQENPLHKGSGLDTDICRFLEGQSPQAFTLTEITENVRDFTSSGTSDGLKGRVQQFVKGAAKKQAVKYYVNQLVALGHVETKVKVDRGAEKVYYRWKEF